MTNTNGQGGSALLHIKRAARGEALRMLAGCDPANGAAVIRTVAANIPPGRVVAAFHPLGQEVDLLPTLRAIWGERCVLALPRTPERGQALRFHRWAAGDALVAERFGTMTSSGPEVDPDMLLVPLLAFDRSGYRLGYGGGYYDRTLASRRGIPAIGCAHAAQEVAAVPAGPLDMRLDAIATEREFIRCASSS